MHASNHRQAWVSLVQPGFPLEPWFWQAYELCFPDRSSRSQPGAGTYLPSSFRNLDVDAPAYVAMHIQSPVPDIPGLRHLYALIQAEKANMAVLVAECLGIEMPSPGATLDPWSLFEGQALVMWVFGVTMALALESVVNKTLRGLELDELPELLEDAQSAYAEALDLASRCQGLRPMGAGFLPEKLKLVCASTADVVDDSRLRDVLVDYGTDVEGADFVAEADQIRQLLGLYRSRSTSEDSDTVSS